MNHRKQVFFWHIFVSVTAMAVLSIPGQAAILEEILVTAQKREQNLQDVGISVTAFSGDQIQELGFRNATDIVFQTPNLNLYEFSPSLSVYNLRGVSQSSFIDSLEAPVAVYVDGAYISSMGALNGQLFDIERVEVLRGPQGTLYGRNATGGLIHYISRPPTQELEVFAEATVGNYGLLETTASVSGPLGEKVRGRIATNYIEQDGYLKWKRSENRFGEAQVHKDIRDNFGKDALAVKGALQFDLSDKALATLRLHWSEDENVPSGSYVRSDVTPDPVTGLGTYIEKNDEPFEYNADMGGFFDRDLFSSTLQFDWEISDRVDFVSITNYLDMDKSYSEDGDSTAAGVPAVVFDSFYVDNDGDPITVQSFFPDQPLGADLPAFNARSDQKFEQVSQEFRFTGNLESLVWQAGLYYLDIESENELEVYGAAAWWTGGAASNFQPSQRAVADWDFDTESWSIFGQADFSLTEDLTLIVGLRYTKDEKEIDLYTRYETKDGVALLEEVDTGASVPIQPVCLGDRVDNRCAGDERDNMAQDDYSDWAGKIQLDWNITKDVLTYFGISKGIKGGNWSVPARSEVINTKGSERLLHDEETLYAYELGFKSTLADGAIRLNGAVFYYDYKDYQAFSLINFSQNISNNDADVYGGEIELFAAPWEGWDFALGIAFLDSKVYDIETPNGPLIDTELPQAPDFSGNGLVRYEFPVGRGSIATQFDFTYMGDHWMEVTNAPVDDEGSYFIANARLSYFSSDRKWRVVGWVKNISDEEYRVYAVDVAGANRPFVGDIYGTPRTYGLTVSRTFE